MGRSEIEEASQRFSADPQQEFDPPAAAEVGAWLGADWGLVGRHLYHQICKLYVDGKYLGTSPVVQQAKAWTTLIDKKLPAGLHEVQVLHGFVKQAGVGRGTAHPAQNLCDGGGTRPSGHGPAELGGGVVQRPLPLREPLAWVAPPSALTGGMRSARLWGSDHRRGPMRRPWFLAALTLAALPLLAQDDRPKFAVPEPKAADRRPAGALTLTEVQYQLTTQADRYSAALPELVRFFKEVSGIRKIETEPNWNQLPADSPRLKQAILVLMTGNQALLQLSEAEKKGLAEYLNGGGLLYAEDIRPSNANGSLEGTDAGVEGTPFDRQFKALMRDPLVLGEQGTRWERISKKHSLYTICFDFADGPPMGGAPGGNVFELEMLQLRGRVAVIFSDLNIGWYWGDPQATLRERGLQFGANLIVFAMTQRMAGLRPSAQ
ncbi:MAG: DUF4159 domain-containing protein [Candidatus Handelsmanbacteria bacterium]|nr:DUF4159 domain-containing protein [Candidatus Handelsmanbacteria bacterium]